MKYNLTAGGGLVDIGSIFGVVEKGSDAAERPTAAIETSTESNLGSKGLDEFFTFWAHFTRRMDGIPIALHPTHV